MKIVFFETEVWEKTYLSAHLRSHNLSFFESRLTSELAKKNTDAEAISIFIYSQVDREILDLLPKLKLITTRSMGYDHIDLAACKEKGIAVCRVPDYGDHTVAEHTFGLILSLSRNIFRARERTEHGEFDYHGLQGFDLFGKTLGVIGGGKIGLNVARIAVSGFGMRVLVYDLFPKAEMAHQIGFQYAPLNELLKESDVLTLHCPYTPETHHLINQKTLSKVKKGALIINTARGAIIDTKALLKALDDGILGGAGLDVVEEECAIKEERELMSKEFPKKCDLSVIISNHILAKRDNVIITPHIGFNSKEALQRILTVTEENILAFENKKPINLCTVKIPE